MTAAEHRPPLSYRLALLAASPLLATHTIGLAIKSRDSRYLLQKLGFGYSQNHPGCVWIHAASVGEIKAAEPLIQALMGKNLDLVISTNTQTGAAQLQQIDERLHHSYLPWDRPNATRSFIKAYRPRCGIVMETEIWPNLYWQCSQSGIPLIIANGRISSRTLNAPTFLRSAYRKALQCVTTILARSAADREAYLALGAPTDKVKVYGNLKSCIQPDRARLADPIGRPYWLAASTHADEEARIAKIWLEIRENRLLVIAPRHPRRSQEVQSHLDALGCRYAARSLGDALKDDTQIYLVDTIGELAAFMSHAEWVFMGGSLVPHGGQNILEAAVLGKAIIVGPHMHNFAYEHEALLKAGGLMEVKDDDELKAALERLLREPEHRAELGANASAFMSRQESVLPAYLSAINTACGI